MTSSMISPHGYVFSLTGKQAVVEAAAGHHGLSTQELLLNTKPDDKLRFPGLRHTFHQKFKVALLFIAGYLALGCVGFALQLHAVTAVVWPASGFSLAMMWRFGSWLLYVAFFAAVITNLVGFYAFQSPDASIEHWRYVLAAMIISVGSALQPFLPILLLESVRDLDTISPTHQLAQVVPSMPHPDSVVSLPPRHCCLPMLRILSGFRLELTTVKGVVYLTITSILIASLSSLFGVFALCTLEIEPWKHAPSIMSAWALGDFSGMLLLFPIAYAMGYTWFSWPPASSQALSVASVFEFLIWLVVGIGMALFVFVANPLSSLDNHAPLQHILHPVLLYGILRFRYFGAAVGVFLLAGITIVGALMRSGPFIRDTFSLDTSMYLSQSYTTVVIIEVLLLNAVLWERDAGKEHLEWKVAKRTAHVLQAQRQAEDALAAKANFLSAMSHEIRTPLHGMIGACEVITATDLDISQRQCLDIIELSSHHLLTIINDILDISKAEGGNMTIDCAKFDLLKCLEAAVTLSTKHDMFDHVQFSFELPASVPTVVMGDAGRVRQIVMNLISNAVKFTKKGYVRMRVTYTELSGRQTIAELIDTLSDKADFVAPIMPGINKSRDEMENEDKKESSPGTRCSLSGTMPFTDPQGVFLISVVDSGHGIDPAMMPLCFQAEFDGITIRSWYVMMSPE